MRPVIGLLLAIVSLSAAADSTGFTIGALRRDGVVIPFAAYDGKHWSARWPAPLKEPEVPINLRSVPSRWWGPQGELDTWQTWIDSRAGAPIHVLQPDVVEAHCVRQVGLRTDYRSAQPPAPPDVQPYPKDGLAISPTQSLEPIEIIEAAAPQLAGLAPVLREAFNREETSTAEHFHHPVDRKIRDAIAPEVEAVYAFGQAPRIYYVEAHRSYGMVETDGHWPFDNSPQCGMAYGTGWFARDEKGFRALDVSVRIVPCDKYGATYMLPFGAMHLGTRTFWIAQFSGWDHERYVVVDISGRAIEAVVNAWGGGC
ncbi:MAG TPA: hypothetical protein VEU08_16055 [Vicinamibacterales bacterium]|nr:hypothetical protein [Vicinamibacterales bacterium]